MRITHIRRAIIGLFIWLLTVLGSVAIMGPQIASASAPSDSVNPWTYQMDNPDKAQPGLIVRGNDGPNGQIFEIYDYLNQPIFTVNKAGGAAVLGDNFGVYSGSDVWHAQSTMSPFEPNAAVCVRDGQTWFGGATGHMWRCQWSNGAFRWVQKI